LTGTRAPTKRRPPPADPPPADPPPADPPPVAPSQLNGRHQTGLPRPNAWAFHFDAGLGSFALGDDPATPANESFDSLFTGFSHWAPGGRARLRASTSLSNSNPKSHQVRVHAEPTPKLGAGLIVCRFLADRSEDDLGDALHRIQNATAARRRSP